MNARQLLFVLVFIALLLLAGSVTLGVKQSRVFAQTNELIVAYESLMQWQKHAEQRPAKESVLNRYAQQIINNLPELVGNTDQPVSELTQYLFDYSASPNQPASVDVFQSDILESAILWELLDCHQQQTRLAHLANYISVGLGFTLLGLGLNAYFMGRRSKDYRLAPFLEDNPNPVFGLNFNGKIIYSNVAANKALQQLLPYSDDVSMLLPDDYGMLLNKLKSEQQTTAVWNRELKDRLYKFSVHLMPNYGRIHIYGEDVTEQEKIRAHNHFLAFHDPICELANRQKYEQLVNDLHDESLDITLVMTRVIGTSALLSNQGLLVVDQFVKDLSARLTRAYRAVDSFGERRAEVIRFDNSLFGCLYFGRLTERQCRYLTSLLEQCGEAPYVSGNREHYFKIKSGAVCEKSSRSAQFVMQKANIALDSLRDPEQSFLLFDESIEAEMRESERVHNALRHAVQLDELAMVYQPQQDLRTGSLVGFEALMRWNNHGKNVPPDVFIPLAEKTGLIHGIGNWAMREVLRQSIDWQNQPAIKLKQIAFNVSAQEFSRQDFIESIEVALADYPATPDTIQIELTESLLIDDEQAAIEKLHTLKELGFTVAIDDFGTGYSSFSYLSRFPIDKLKIDRSFITNMANGERDIAIVAAMINVAHRLGIGVIAEGVETLEQRDILLSMECDQIQGFLFGKPMNSVDATLFCVNEGVSQ
ncbi:putative bifunctional diguanylate cyclase/phosphodiesterase [Reinekea thalattae]|uniref:EAL domain-containing protein n=1 Tax=Reinekea thalattae TaxID=2593301 RepID=A0A5C8Z4N5_9GAMM|nr:EAL domain-containing protein [Reinekea thalattae]TXR51876.1 EAL domain-containing protein [Reinekea thalattae]